MGLNLGLLPILGELLAGRRLALDRALPRGGAAASSRLRAAVRRRCPRACGPPSVWARLSARSARWAELGESGQCGLRRSWGGKRGGMMQGGGE
eukprot:1355639-Prymnesium_polylepis.1